MTMIKRTVLAIAIAGTLMTPASAQAQVPGHGLYRSKSDARAQTVAFARTIYLDLEWATDFWVVHASQCSRIHSRSVECRYQVQGNATGYTCEDTLRVTLSRYTARRSLTTPYEAACFESEPDY
jgi:hypothetical protein